MAAIKWANPVKGDFTTAADWTGGMVPGKNDTAVIAGGPGRYTITVDTQVLLAGLRLRYHRATVAVTNHLTVRELDLKSGTLALDGGTLSGTVLALGGTLAIGSGSNATLDHVTWRGELAPDAYFYGGETLTIRNGITLTGADGSGAGTASFNLPLLLEGTPVLDNATIQIRADPSNYQYDLSFMGASLTLGTHLDLSVIPVYVGGGQTLTNDGTLHAAQVNLTAVSATGTIINNGLWYGCEEQAAYFQNNGTISGGVELAYQGLQAAGPSGVLDLGNNEFDLIGNMTTAQFIAAYNSQNVQDTNHGYSFGVIGTLTNSGNMLQVGQGTMLGQLGLGTIVGGTIIDSSNVLAVDSTSDYLELDDLTLQTSSATFTIHPCVLTDTILTGATTIYCDDNGGFTKITGGTLSGVGTLNLAAVALNGVDITGVGDSGQVQINVVYGETFPSPTLEIGALQSVAGYTIDVVSSETIIALDGGAVLDDAIISVAKNIQTEFDVSSNATQSVTIGSTTTIGVSTGSTVSLNAAAAASLFNQATITNAGLLKVGGPFYNEGVIAGGSDSFNGTLVNSGTITVGHGGTLSLLGATDVINTGTIAVTGGELDVNLSALNNTGSFSVANGTLGLYTDANGGTLTVGSLTAISAPGSIVDLLYGVLDLGGQSITVGRDGIPQFALAGALASIVDGTLSILHKDSFTDAGTISASLINDGTINIAGDSNAIFNGAVTGTGTIAITGGYAQAEINAQIASQTILFNAQAEKLVFSAQSAAEFGGTLSGFSLYDLVVVAGDHVTAATFVGDSISVTLNGGKTLSFATSTALEGSLTVTNYQGTATIDYTSTEMAQSDWNIVHTTPSAGGASVDTRPEAGGALRWEQGDNLIHDVPAMHWPL